MNRDALAALERLGQNAQYELAIAEILEPLYRAQGDYQKLIGVHEVQVARADDAERKVELLHQIAALYEDAAGDLNAAFDTLARALAVDPAHDGHAESIDRLARATGRLLGPRARVRGARGGADRPRARQPALRCRGARLRERRAERRPRHRALPARCSRIDPTNLAAAESLQALFQGAERYADMSLILQRKAEMLDDVERAEGRALPGRARSKRRCSSGRDEAIAVYHKVLEIDPEDIRTIDALVKLYLALSALGRAARASTRRRPISSLDPDEKKLILYQVGAVYERELGDVRRAIDTYQKRARARSGRPHGARPPRRALPDRRELERAARRAHARGGAHAGSRRGDRATSTGSPSSTRSTSTTSSARSSSTARS